MPLVSPISEIPNEPVTVLGKIGFAQLPHIEERSQIVQSLNQFETYIKELAQKEKT